MSSSANVDNILRSIEIKFTSLNQEVLFPQPSPFPFSSGIYISHCRIQNTKLKKLMADFSIIDHTNVEKYGKTTAKSQECGEQLQLEHRHSVHVHEEMREREWGLIF
ncbi:hypothetical protein Ancab_010419 [Ancistrocladus abbreviatus]